MEVSNFKTINEKIEKLEKRIKDLEFHFEVLEKKQDELDWRFEELEQEVMDKLELINKNI